MSILKCLASAVLALVKLCHKALCDPAPPELYTPPGFCGAVCSCRWWLPGRTIAVSSPPPGSPAGTCSLGPGWENMRFHDRHLSL